MSKKVAFLTIGQSPREDIFADIIPRLSSTCQVIQAGALDALNREEIDCLKPEEGHLPLITRLRNGQAVIVSREKILPLLQARINSLEQEGVEIIAVLCTEDFSDLPSKKKLLLPFDLLKKEILKHSPSGLIVFIPLKEQRKLAETKWQTLEIELLIEILNPYQDVSNFTLLTNRLKRRGNFLLVFDCLGYSISLAQSISQELALPFLVPRLILVQEINHLISEVRTEA
jgi:protein AroM